VGGSSDGRVVEYVDHLHDHFVDPAVVTAGHYQAPTAPGTSITMHPSSITAYSYPLGAEWSGALVGGV
jgi:L-fuconate dehydratase